MDLASKTKLIRDIPNEKDLREELLVPLFRNTGAYSKVLHVHGPEERGKDIVLVSKDPLNDLNYTAVIVKHGDITHAASHRSKVTVSEIISQLTMSQNSGFNCLDTNRRVGFNRFMVVTNGSVSTSASDEILKKAEELKISGLSIKDADAITDLADQYLPEFFTFGNGTLSAYMKALKKRCENLDELRSISIYRGDVKRLIDVFVSPVLMRVRNNPDKDKPEPIYSRSLQSVLQQDQNVIITGGPGAGKSTVLRAHCNDVLEHSERGDDLNLPILVRAKALMACSGSDLRAKLAAYVNREYSTDLEAIFKFDQEIANVNSVTFLIDGYDEISEREQRREFCRLINAFEHPQMRVRFVLTTRDNYSSEWSSLKHFKNWEILPFNFRQAQAFVESWFSAAVGSQSALLRALRDHELLSKLPNTPLVLTLLAVLFDSDTEVEVPANLSELYKMFVDLLIGKWSLDRRVESMFGATQKELVLGEVARAMHHSGKVTIQTDEVRNIVDDALTRLGVAYDRGKFFTELLDSGLLVTNNEEVEFRHLSFQEYLYANRLTKDPETEVETTFVRYFGDPWWMPVCYFYMGTRQGAGALLERLSGRTSELSTGRVIRTAVNFGYLIQSTYLADASLRARCTQQQLMAVGQNLGKFLEDVSTLRPNGLDLPPALLAICIFEWLKTYYRSRFLKPVYERAFNECTADERFETGFTRLVLGVLISETGDMRCLNAAYEQARHYPLLQVLLDFQITLLFEDKEADDIVRALRHKLRRKMRKSRDAIRYYFEQPHRSLPAASAEAGASRSGDDNDAD